MTTWTNTDEHGRRSDTTGRTTKERADVFLGARMASDLALRLEKLAKENDRSISAELRLAIRHWLDEDDATRRGWIEMRTGATVNQ